MALPNLPLNDLSDRELLLLACQSLNTLTERQDADHEVIHGKGVWLGLRSQVLLLWILAGGLWSIVLVVAAGVLRNMAG